ncbi:MAG: hypothetical protein ACYTG1_09940 [Planctomycetota bacterium]|jgi:hypothetical protein
MIGRTTGGAGLVAAAIIAIVARAEPPPADPDPADPSDADPSQVDPTAEPAPVAAADPEGIAPGPRDAAAEPDAVDLPAPGRAGDTTRSRRVTERLLDDGRPPGGPRPAVADVEEADASVTTLAEAAPPDPEEISWRLSLALDRLLDGDLAAGDPDDGRVVLLRSVDIQVPATETWSAADVRVPAEMITGDSDWTDADSGSGHVSLGLQVPAPPAAALLVGAVLATGRRRRAA